MGLAQSRLGDVPTLRRGHQRVQHPVLGRRVMTHQEHVDPGAHGVDRRGLRVGDGLHLQIVADRHALETEAFAQQAGD